MTHTDPYIWDLIQMMTAGLAGVILIIFYIIATIQLCRAKFFLLQMTDTFLFYFTFISCVFTTLSQFLKIFAIWSLDNALDLLLQIAFFLIFALIIDPQKRIYLLWKAFKYAALITAILFASITIIEYLEALKTLTRGWPCSGFLGLILPAFTLIVSIALTITACIVTCRRKQPPKTPDQYSQLLDLTPPPLHQQESEEQLSMSFQKYIKMKSMRIKKAQESERKIKPQYSFRHQQPLMMSQPSQISSIDRKATIKKYKQFLNFTKTTNIEKLVADYCYASQKELEIKKTEVLVLIAVNLGSILLSIGVAIFLVSQASPSFLPVHVKTECSDAFHFSIWESVVVNLLRMIGEYAIIGLVFYIIFWKHRHAARGDSLESSFDFIIESDEEGDPLREQFLLVNEKKQPEGQDDDNSDGENFADWIHRKSDAENGQRKSSKFKKRKLSPLPDGGNIQRQRNSSVHGNGFRPSKTLQKVEALKREESHIGEQWG